MGMAAGRVTPCAPGRGQTDGGAHLHSGTGILPVRSKEREVGGWAETQDKMPVPLNRFGLDEI
jgi:hypothetical protein